MKWLKWLLAIAVLGAVILMFFPPSIIPAKNRARLTWALNNCRQFGLAANAFRSEKGRLPANLEELISAKMLGPREAEKLLDPPGLYFLSAGSGPNGKDSVSVSYYSPEGTAKYSDQGVNEIHETKKKSP